MILCAYTVLLCLLCVGAMLMDLIFPCLYSFMFDVYALTTQCMGSVNATGKQKGRIFFFSMYIVENFVAIAFHISHAILLIT